jgi:hypothetical protein
LKFVSNIILCLETLQFNFTSSKWFQVSEEAEVPQEEEEEVHPEEGEDHLAEEHQGVEVEEDQEAAVEVAVVEPEAVSELEPRSSYNHMRDSRESTS